MSAPTLFRSRDSQDDPAVALVQAISQQDAESDILSFTKEIGPLSYIVEPFLRSASLYTLTAATGSGKTALLVSMAFAVATGRGDILGQEVQLGRVAYFTAENPDDLRMRFAVGLDALGIKAADVRGRISVFDRKMSPEEMVRKFVPLGDINLIIVDTLAAFFDGGDANDNVAGGDFMRRFRPLTQLPGNPTVIVAAHPKKNAGLDDLKPYGAGAILNEVDGNLTLQSKMGMTRLHWQGKLRGVEFEPLTFRIGLETAPIVRDVKGRLVPMPMLKAAPAGESERRPQDAADNGTKVLEALRDNPGASLADLATASGVPKTSVDRQLKRLASVMGGKAVVQAGEKWSITKAGLEMLQSEKPDTVVGAEMTAGSAFPLAVPPVERHARPVPRNDAGTRHRKTPAIVVVPPGTIPGTKTSSHAVPFRPSP